MAIYHRTFAWILGIFCTGLRKFPLTSIKGRSLSRLVFISRLICLKIATYSYRFSLSESPKASKFYHENILTSIDKYILPLMILIQHVTDLKKPLNITPGHTELIETYYYVDGYI